MMLAMLSVGCLMLLAVNGERSELQKKDAFKPGVHNEVAQANLHPNSWSGVLQHTRRSALGNCGDEQMFTVNSELLSWFANELVKESQVPVKWQHLPEMWNIAIIKQVKDRLIDPLGCINQGSQRFCGFATYLAMFVVAEPVKYAQKVLDLFKNGVTKSNGQPVPSSDAIYSTDPKTRGLDLVDWMTMVWLQSNCPCGGGSVADIENQGVTECCMRKNKRILFPSSNFVERNFVGRDNKPSAIEDSEWMSIKNEAKEDNTLVILSIFAANNVDELNNWEGEDKRIAGNHIVMLAHVADDDTQEDNGQDQLCYIWTWADKFNGDCHLLRRIVDVAWSVTVSSVHASESVSRIQTMKAKVLPDPTLAENFEHEFFLDG
mmetsp:Transcript_63346/g.125280  ORF Transcript_63346/g.125280 Transcript_63346/m.125280 type:complete len:376 (-) Transcript_63346:85-1212(-)